MRLPAQAARQRGAQGDRRQVTTVLTEAEKAAGRVFRERARARMEALALPLDPVEIPDVVHHVRHECPRSADERTVSLEAVEHYILNPAMEDLNEGKLAFIWRQGRCRCGHAVWSGSGRVVAVADRPPSRGARQVFLT